MAIAFGSAAARSIWSRSARSKPSVLWGWSPTMAKTSSYVRAASSARSTEAGLVPTVARRVSPASRARSTSSPSGGSQWSRWQWVSITAGWRPLAAGARARRPAPSGRGRLGGLHAREELPQLAELRAAPRGPQPGPLQRQVLLSERLEQALGRARHERVQQHRHDPQSLGHRIE